MATTLIHDQLALTYPDSFAVMGADELREGYLDDNPNRWGIWDRNRHVIIVVYWHDSNAFLARLVSTKDLAKRAQKLVAKAYAGHGYQLGQFFETQVGGQQAHGFGYRYDLQGTGQVAEAVVTKYGKCCYTLYYYAREEGSPTDREVFKDVLQSASFA